MNKRKVSVCLVGKDYPLQIRKASLDLDIRAVEFRMRFLGDRQMLVVPDGVEPYPYKKGRGLGLLYFADPIKKVCVGLGEVTGVISAELDAKVDMYTRTKFWRFVGGRVLGLIETLIYLLAGYGLFRLLEIFIAGLFK
jgi:hypothetical protein